MTIDSRDLIAGLSRLERDQAPYAAARALTDVAWGAARGLKAHADQVFDRPTAFTKNAFRVIGAKKTNLEAVVTPKTKQGGRHYLFTQEGGGVRPQTGLEQLLSQHAAFDGVLRAALPADGAKLNRAGNLSAPQIQRLLSGLGAQRDARQNTTGRSRRRNASRETFFVPRRGLSPGVFARDARGRLRMILAFTDRAPRYDARFGFEDFVEAHMRAEIGAAFTQWLARAMDTAQ